MKEINDNFAALLEFYCMTTLKETQNIEYWTAADLMSKHSSRQLNPNIANGFFRSGLIEAWGRGIEKMCSACKSYNAPEPQYLVHSNDIMILFKASGKYLELANNKVTENYPENDLKVTEKVTEKQFAIIELLRVSPNITQAQIASQIGISRHHVAINISKLKNMNLIRRIGSDRGGHWEVIEK